MSIRERVENQKALLSLSRSLNRKHRGLKRRFRVASTLVWSNLHARDIARVTRVLDAECLKPVLQINPRVVRKPFRPYVCIGWGKERRIDEINGHHQCLLQRFGSRVEAIYTGHGIKLLEVQDNEEQPYEVYLDQGLNKEGGLGLSLKNSLGQRVFTISFSLSERDGGVMYIGAVQGPTNRVENREQVIRALTKGMHGLRPKSLVVELALMLARQLGLAKVYAVTNKGHIYQSPRYIGRKRNAVRFDYDAQWLEHSGEPVNEHFFQLPLMPVRKDTATLKRSKRRLYTKRYEWLDGLEQQFAQQLHEVTLH
ncbi:MULTISPECIES: VirK/YbjX family protein [Ferrimonas]|uniref:VirK/YbjX family protein n=1 Tax=Ferrimonas TaxID=44011 RepID=UPI000686AC58|nr:MULTISPECIES: VirK/YbjX family protein [Ferrimonas]USD38118.1 DUF535 domain-containing protein [Ferrimonas sp. SCSIO 43195]